jgi:hypothetical protein
MLFYPHITSNLTGVEFGLVLESTVENYKLNQLMTLSVASR